MTSPKRGRPALPPELQRIKRGVSLTQESWGQLSDLTRWWGVSADRALERIIAVAVEQAHSNEAAFQGDPEVPAEDKTPRGVIPTDPI